MEGKSPYLCIYMLKGMFRHTVNADSIRDLYEKLSGTSVVYGDDIEGLSDLEILNKIYADAEETTGRLTVYKYNPDFDDEEAEDDFDEYLICKHGVV